MTGRRCTCHPDDKIIADHVEQAYLRANEVIAEMEKCDE